MSAYDDLESRLRASVSAPFLFVGAGLSRRYLGLDGWTDLLRRMAAFTPRPYAYYVTKAGNNLPRVATEIAAVFHEIWWTDDRFGGSRAIYGETLSALEGPLKVEVSRYADEALGGRRRDEPLAHELELLARAVVDGVITTNYDGLLETVFPDFKTFVGQDELLFSDAQGIGEIYQIHGSARDPESLVLTEADYQQFSERNPYLAAKLLTTFVEHPVIFVGYSLTDPDVTALIVSIARVLTTEKLDRLRDRLIFVKWEKDAAEPSLVPTQIAVEDFTIPILVLTVPDFEGVFDVLSRLPRRFPAKLLRRLKEQVSELVRSTSPDTRLAVVDIEDNTRADEIEVVFGVGIQDQLADFGYVGLQRPELLRGVLGAQFRGNPRRIVMETLPRVFRATDHTPVFRFLREAGLLYEDGSLRDATGLDPRIVTRVAQGPSRLAVPRGSEARASALVREAGEDFDVLALHRNRDEVFLALLAFPRQSLNLDSVRRYLLDNADAFDDRATRTQWAKAVCLYDYYRYGAIQIPRVEAAP